MIYLFKLQAVIAFRRMLDQQKVKLGGTMAAVSIFLLIRQSIVGFDRPLPITSGFRINEFGHMSFDVVRGQKRSTHQHQLYP